MSDDTNSNKKEDKYEIQKDSDGNPIVFGRRMHRAPKGMQFMDSDGCDRG